MGQVRHGSAMTTHAVRAAIQRSQAALVQMAFNPDWTKHAKATPFKRNDAMRDHSDVRNICAKPFAVAASSTCRAGSRW